MASQEEKDAWIQDPANYKWGLFYANPLDERLIVPKRIAWMGWSFNFSNPKSIFIILGILVGAFLINYFIK
jgi:uncharacterized membrane protein